MAVVSMDWLNQRASNSYPLTQLSVQAGINCSFILDATIFVPQQSKDIKSSCFYLSKIQDTSNGLRLLVSYFESADTTYDVGWTSFIPKNLKLIRFDVQNDTRVFHIKPELDMFKNCIITLCIGQTQTYNKGSMQLTHQAGLLKPLSRGVYKPLVLPSGVQSINGLTGDVIIQAGQHASISVNQQTNTITISYNLPQLDQLLADYVKSINGIKPINGNINLIGSDCIKVTDHPGLITIQNPCGKPCCDSQNSYTQLSQALFNLEYQKSVLMDSFQSISNNINYMQSNLSLLMGT